MTVSAPRELDRGLLLQTRRLSDESQLIFLCNQEAGKGQATISLSDGAPKAAETWDLTTGTVERIPSAWTTASSVTIPVEPYAAVVLRIPAITSEATPPVPRAHLRLDAQSDWSIHAEGPNIARFGRFQFQFIPGDQPEPPKASDSKILVDTKTILATLAELGQDSHPALTFREAFGIPIHLGLAYPSTAWYRVQFEVHALPTQCHLLMDSHAIRGQTTLFLNHHAITRDQFQIRPLYDQENQQVDVTEDLTLGINELCVRVLINGDDDGLVDPLYLVGNFGISLGEPEAPIRLTALPRSHQNCGLVPRGYPYYSGTLCFSRHFTLDTIFSEAEFELDFDHWPATFHECAEVLINGVSLGVKAWMPYRFVASTAILQPGLNQVEVRVTQSLSRTFEGRYFDDQLQAMRPITADALE